MDKSEIRRVMRARRKALPPEERARAARAVCDRISADEFFRAALDPSNGGRVIAVYLASPDEIDLSASIEAMRTRGATVVVPRWMGETYGLAKLKSLRVEDLRPGPMGVREPKDAEIVPPEQVGVWLVPGLAFTRDGKRLGYGGGWYDRLLADAGPQAKKFGVAYPFQIVDDLPTEPHDIRLDGVIESTRRGIGGGTVRAIVSLGSNIEPRRETIERALAALSALPDTRLVKTSSIAETEPVDVPEEFLRLKFLNCVAILETALAPLDFSRRMHGIEDALGRVRTVRNGPRTIDIDLIDFGGLRMETPELTLPHPRWQGRAFVREPLAELKVEMKGAIVQ